MKKYLSQKETAEFYGLSESWLAKLRVYGGGPSYIKAGKRILYDHETFEKWLESNRQ